MSTAAELFEQTWGTPPTGIWSAPGRVNLIGEHTDYNSGLVLPFAIDARARVAASLTDDGMVSVVSRRDPGEVLDAGIADLTPGGAGAQGWSAYLNGAVWVLREAGHTVPGVRLAVSSTVPVGAGLSSSAALECATLLALSDLLDLDLDRPAIARLAQRDENDFVGVPCGLMDQMASAACTAGNVLSFDIGADRIDQVPFDPAADDLRVLVVDTKVSHALVDGEYARRRASCEAAAAELGVPHLSAVTVDGLDATLSRLSDGLLRRRARHVITENARVAEVVALLRAGRVADIGPLMTASHASLRDDYEVSDPALDLAVDTAVTHGALGARMTGGGFGGSAIALLPGRLVDAVGDAVTAAFAAEGRHAPVLRTVVPSAGAARD